MAAVASQITSLTLRVTSPCAGKSPVTAEFPAQKASNAENVSIWWRHHGMKWIMYGVLSLHLSTSTDYLFEEKGVGTADEPLASCMMILF